MEELPTNPLVPVPEIPPTALDPLRPPPTAYKSFVRGMIPVSNLAALSGYYFAIFSLVPIAGILLGPFALIFGLIGMGRALQDPHARGLGHAIFSVAMGIFTTIFNWGVAIVIGTLWLLWPDLFQNFKRLW